MEEFLLWHLNGPHEIQKHPLMDRKVHTRKARGQKKSAKSAALSFHVLFRAIAWIRQFHRNATLHCLMSLLDRRCGIVLFRHLKHIFYERIPFLLPFPPFLDAISGFGDSE